MRTGWAVIALAAVFLLAGCANSDVTSDQDKKNQADFSADNYEKNMIAAGKKEELEKQKKAAEAHQDAGRDDSQK